MSGLEHLLAKKFQAIKECEEFQSYIKDNYMDLMSPDANSCKLIALLGQKKELYNEISYENHAEISTKLIALEDKIYNLIALIRREISDDFHYDDDLHNKYKKILAIPHIDFLARHPELLRQTSEFNQIKDDLRNNKFFNKYLSQKSSEIKTRIFMRIWDFIKNRQGISIAGFILVSVSYILIYFLSLGYFPVFSQNDNLYLLGLVAFVSLVASIAVYALIWLMSSIYVSDAREGKFDGKFLLIFKSPFLWLMVFTLMLAALTAFKLSWYFFIMFVFAYLLLKNRKNETLIMIFVGLFVFLAFILSIVFSKNGQTTLSTFVSTFTLIVGFAFVWIFTTGDFTDEDDVKFIVASLIVIVFVGGMSFLNYTMRQLNYGDIDYKFISLDKKALEALPKEICAKDCDEYFCINDGSCHKNASVVSYIDNNLTIVDKNNATKSFTEISLKCLKFTGKNGDELSIDKNESIKFSGGVLSFTNGGAKKIESNAAIKSFPEICMTYVEKSDDALKLYNVKALSALGKFYYLQTKSGEKFELDSSLIISKQKANDVR